MEITFTLSQQEAMVVLQALGELPLKISGPIFTKIQQQTQEAKGLRNADQAEINQRANK